MAELILIRYAMVLKPVSCEVMIEGSISDLDGLSEESLRIRNKIAIDLFSKKYRKRIVKSKKGKGSFKRKKNKGFY